MYCKKLSIPLAGLLLFVGFSSVRAQADLNELQEKAIKAAVKKVAPSVVQIETTGGTEVISTGPRGKPVRKGVGPTTGLVVSNDGYIISSAFNFANKPSAIFVTIPNHDQRYVAKEIATDRSRMLTLLKVEAKDLVIPAPVPRKDIRIGQWAVALGRALERPGDRKLEGMPTVSIGIISAVNRIWGKAIQTDAKVSPVNYGGPLVDIAGRVQGILVPASPRAEGETAGVEWYDSGIGFAIPLEDINRVLPRLKEGKDLRNGQLGIRMQGRDMYGSAPVVASVSANSAASRAGIKQGDAITAIDGHPVNSQAQLRHQLGSKYDGDTITVSIKRGGKTIQLKNVRLGGALTSKTHPFIGVLPVRDDPEPGEEVRFVYPNSPAAKAGIKAGDRIMKIGVGTRMRAFSGRNQLTALLNSLNPGMEIKLELKRKEGGKTETVTLKLDKLPNAVPEELTGTATAKKALTPQKPVGGRPPKKGVEKKGPAKKPETGFFKRRSADGSREYWVLVPDDYDPNIAYGVLVWLHPVNKNKDKDFEDFKDVWGPVCAAQHMIVVAPKAEKENGWLSSEADEVIQLVRDVMSEYSTDSQRVVAHGMGVGGHMAFYLGFRARDLFRGVATTGSVVATQIKDNVANQRLQFYIIAGGKDPLAKDIRESKDSLVKKNFSVIYREIPDMGHQYLDAKTLVELVRWLGSLDRQ